MPAERESFLARVKRGRLLFDGGMGSMLIGRGLEPGAPPEQWNLERGADVRDVHAAYLRAGAEVITTNTFGATPSRLDGYDLGNHIDAVINKAVRLAREANSNHGSNPDHYVALSVGPTGKMLSPLGNADEAEIKAEFDGQLRCLEQPVDLVLGETFFDIREALAALNAAKKRVDAPVGICVTFNRTPRGFFTVMGDTVHDALVRLEDAGADFVGANCSIASADMVELAAEMRTATRLPLLCQPNAGQPAVKDGKPVYEQSPASFAADIEGILYAGIEAVGGCCGSTPEFIRQARTKVDGFN